jgi:hypothetical protein
VPIDSTEIGLGGPKIEGFEAANVRQLFANLTVFLVPLAQKMRK